MRLMFMEFLNKKMNYLKIVLAVLLLLCLLDMPYGFYILIRYVATVVFGYMAYSYYQENKNELAIVAGALAVLFQPLVKFALGRFVWNVVDVVVAIALVVLVFVEHKNNKERKLWKSKQRCRIYFAMCYCKRWFCRV